MQNNEDYNTWTIASNSIFSYYDGCNNIVQGTKFKSGTIGKILFQKINASTAKAYTNIMFTDMYTLTVESSGNGTVSGGGIYSEGEQAIISATPATGYHFTQWSDGVSTNPRTVTVTGSATYRAVFEINTYTITVNVTSGSGTVTGGGTYNYGTRVTLTPIPESGFKFSRWSDGNTSNPRYVTANDNITLGVTFVAISSVYTIQWGESITSSGMDGEDEWTVQGYNLRQISFECNNTVFTELYVDSEGNMYYINSNSQILVYSCYDEGEWEVNWAKEITMTDDPASIFIGMTGEDAWGQFLAQNGTVTEGGFTVSVAVSPAGSGTATKSPNKSSYSSGDSVTCTATANTGYTFSSWLDGSTSNPRTISVTDNISLTALFNINSYTLTVTASPAGGGSVTGGGTYNYGAAVTLTATPASGYNFVQWNDGNNNPSRTVTVTSSTTYTATFSSTPTYTITTVVTPSDSPVVGTVTGGGTYQSGATATLTATPASGCIFNRWSDGVSTNPRTVTVSGNATYTAEFLYKVEWKDIIDTWYEAGEDEEEEDPTIDSWDVRYTTLNINFVSNGTQYSSMYAGGAETFLDYGNTDVYAYDTVPEWHNPNHKIIYTSVNPDTAFTGDWHCFLESNKISQ